MKKNTNGGTYKKKRSEIRKPEDVKNKGFPLQNIHHAQIVSPSIHHLSLFTGLKR